MSRRLRATGFACAAAVCAGLAASATGGGDQGLEDELGTLREVVVATRRLPARRPMGKAALRGSLDVRRVPARFAPPDALTAPEQALGRTPVTPVPAGGYLLGSQLRAAGAGASRERPGPRLDPGRRPVQITVEGAAPLADEESRAGQRVDVVVTTEPGPGGSGRTYVAARAVTLLDLTPAGGEEGATDVIPGPQGASWLATLALTRDQALRLIEAESFARSVRLIGR